MEADRNRTGEAAAAAEGQVGRHTTDIDFETLDYENLSGGEDTDVWVTTYVPAPQMQVLQVVMPVAPIPSGGHRTVSPGWSNVTDYQIWCKVSDGTWFAFLCTNQTEPIASSAFQRQVGNPSSGTLPGKYQMNGGPWTDVTGNRGTPPAGVH